MRIFTYQIYAQCLTIPNALRISLSYFQSFSHSLYYRPVRSVVGDWAGHASFGRKKFANDRRKKKKSKRESKFHITHSQCAHCVGHWTGWSKIRFGMHVIVFMDEIWSEIIFGNLFVFGICVFLIFQTSI